MTPLVVSAPAKVNLFLHVTGRRADGYHTLESLFVLVDLADTLTLALRADGRIRRAGDVAGVDPDDDLVLRAARALQQACGTRLGVEYSIDKGIAIGAGLGGGSSDAASALLALNRLWSLGWSRAALAEVALSLGADVPFFVHGASALATGIGDKLRAVTLPTLWIVLVIPPVVVPTASVFTAPELTRDTPSAKMSVFSAVYGRNDLEPVAAARYPEVASALQALRRVAAHARMSGSGAAIFATYGNEQDALAAAAQVPSARVVRTLAKHPLASFA